MEIVEQFISDRMLSDKTARNYKTIIQQYEEYCGLSMGELIAEADREEEAGVRWKRSQLKHRLIGFRNHCADNISHNSVTTYFNAVKAVYRHFEIEIGDIPKLGKQTFKYQEQSYKDLLTKKELKQAYSHADGVIKPAILFMLSTGITRYDICYSVTVQDFIDACQEYLTTDTLEEQLNELAIQDVVPSFYLQRNKTKKWFYTFCTPEATREVVTYLRHRNQRIKKNHNSWRMRFPKEKLEYSDPLFKMTDQTLANKLIAINDELNLGKSGAYRKLRPHMLRKFHASTLLNTKKFTVDEVDYLQGRSKDKIHTAYFKHDPKVLKEQYIDCIEALTIVDSEYYDLYHLRKEKENLETKIDDQEILIQEILEVQKEMQELMK